MPGHMYSISQEICTRFLLCCALLWLYIDWFSISITLTSLAQWQSNDCPCASKVTLMNMDKYFIWIHYERLHNHNKAKHNKTVCIFLGIYCMIISWAISYTALDNISSICWSQGWCTRLLVHMFTIQCICLPYTDLYILILNTVACPYRHKQLLQVNNTQNNIHFREDYTNSHRQVACRVPTNNWPIWLDIYL